MTQTRAGTGPRALRSITAVTRAFLGFYMLMLGLQGIYFASLALREVSEGYTMFLVIYPSTALSLFVLTLITAVPLLVWVWQAHNNLRADRLDGLKTTPAWAVLGLIIPVVNLIVPPTAMRELWNRSHGEPEWFAQQSVDKVSSWWTCFVVGSLIEAALVIQTGFNLLTNLKIIVPAGVNTGLHMFAVVLLGMSAWFLLRIVGAVAKAQQTVVSVGDAFA
ncbi:DUF4328 domain-containing protein [Novosphingobium sp.]|uniref:DUF4328 domain-containing protein n=1 Tax=Novosphingobium sp. TaxID=1874826 RepID=UPI0035B4C8E3